MAGGKGSRFWPLSTEQRPKQFLDILGVGETLLQTTYRRALKIVSKENIFIITHFTYEDLISEQVTGIAKTNVLLEPTRNNTAPSIAFSILKLKDLNPKANIAFLPSDHIILKEDEFVKSVNQAFKYASDKDCLITLGITPSRADTGYGYIEVSPQEKQDSEKILMEVKNFHEKPKIELAKEYLNSGNHFWNAGVFISSVNFLYQEFKTYAKDVIDILDKQVYNTNEEADFIEKNYALTSSISFDFAIAEKSKKVYIIPCDCGWTDLGTWLSRHNFLQKNQLGNTSNVENLHLVNSTGNTFHFGKEKKVIIRDLNNFIIVDVDEALLIYPMDKEQELKKELISMSENNIEI